MTITFKKLTKLLKKRHLTKKDLANQAAIHPSTITRFSTGYSDVRIETLHAICQVLGCNISDIVEFNFEEQDNL